MPTLVHSGLQLDSAPAVTSAPLHRVVLIHLGLLAALCPLTSCLPAPVVVKLDDAQATNLASIFNTAAGQRFKLEHDISSDLTAKLKDLKTALSMPLKLEHSLDAALATRLTSSIEEVRALALPLALREALIPSDWVFYLRYCKGGEGGGDSIADDLTSAWKELYSEVSESGSWPEFDLNAITTPEQLYTEMTGSIGIGVSHRGLPALRIGARMTPLGEVDAISFSGYYQDFKVDFETGASATKDKNRLEVPDLMTDLKVATASAAAVRHFVSRYLTHQEAARTRGFHFEGEVSLGNKSADSKSVPLIDLLKRDSLSAALEHHGFYRKGTDQRARWHSFPPNGHGNLTLVAHPRIDNNGEMLLFGDIEWRASSPSDFCVRVADFFAAPAVSIAETRSQRTSTTSR